jgi:hypothetical protein
MSRTLTAADRSALIRLASTLPVGGAERKALLDVLAGNKTARRYTKAMLDLGNRVMDSFGTALRTKADLKIALSIPLAHGNLRQNGPASFSTSGGALTMSLHWIFVDSESKVDHRFGASAHFTDLGDRVKVSLYGGSPANPLTKMAKTVSWSGLADVLKAWVSETDRAVSA